MSANKRQQTMAKIRREQAVREKRELKQEKKEAARRAKASEDALLPTPEEQNETSDVPLARAVD